MAKTCKRCGGSGDLYLVESPDGAKRTANYGNAKYLEDSCGYKILHEIQCGTCGGYGIVDGD